MELFRKERRWEGAAAKFRRGLRARPRKRPSGWGQTPGKNSRASLNCTGDRLYDPPMYALRPSPQLNCHFRIRPPFRPSLRGTRACMIRRT